MMTEMTDRFRQTAHTLWAISEEIYEYAYDHYLLPTEWEGAEVSITSTPRAARAKSDAGQLAIVTSAAPEIAWLFGRLGDAFGKLGSGVFKTQLYGRLGRVIVDHERTSDREYKVNSILRAVVNEAFATLEEMEKGKFASHPSAIEIHPGRVRNVKRSPERQEAVC